MFDLLLILVIILCNSLWVFGFWFSTQEGMINEWIDKLMPAKAFPSDKEGYPEWLRKPLFSCPICMASVHSFIFPLIILAFGFDWSMLYGLPFYIVMLSGLNGIILSLQK